MRANLVGLDIGSTSLRAVELKMHRTGRPTLSHSHEIPLPSGAVVRGAVIDADAVNGALKRLWTQGGFKSKKVVLGAGNQGVLVRNLSVPKMPIKHIQKSLPFYVQSLLQTPITESLLDFYATSESQGEKGAVINGLLVAAGKKAMLETIRVVETAGLTPAEVEITPFALNRILINRPEGSGTVAIIDIGATSTSIVVSTDGIPSFVRIISAGGEDLTQALQVGLGIAGESAENLKRSLKYQFQEEGIENFFYAELEKARKEPHLNSPTVIELRSHEILRTVIDELLSALRSTIKYVNNLRPEDPVVRILLTGGGSRLPGISEALSDITSLSVKNIDPISAFTLPRKKNPKRSVIDSSMTVALGLALRNAS